MVEEHLITQEGELLDGDGNLREAGYCTTPLLRYDQNAIRAPKKRIKEWDYYMVMNNDYAVAFTVSDQRYMQLHTIGFMDFADKSARTLRKLKLLNKPKLSFAPPHEKGAVAYDGKTLKIAYTPTNDGVHIKASAPSFFGEPLECDLNLFDYPRDHMVIATPFFDRKYFYYNMKTNCIRASGTVKLGGKTVTFGDDSFAVYDCGRGAWTMRNRWYWATASFALPDGKRFGFNLGYGFGDTSAASENMLFCDGIAHKLKRVTIDIPHRDGKEDYMGGTWHYHDEEGRLNLDFVPIVVRVDKLHVLSNFSDQHQTFGRFSGTVVLDDGTKVEIKDVIGACEVFDNNG